MSEHWHMCDCDECLNPPTGMPGTFYCEPKWCSRLCPELIETVDFIRRHKSPRAGVLLGEIQDALGISYKTAHWRIRELLNSGLVVQRRERMRNGRRMYSLTPTALHQVARWRE